MTTLLEASRLALEALEWDYVGDKHQRKQGEAITSLRQAIEQAQKQIPPSAYSNTHQSEQEPVVWLTEERYAQLHTAQRQWVGLTDEERKDLCRWWSSPMDAIYATEAKLKEKNT